MNQKNSFFNKRFLTHGVLFVLISMQMQSVQPSVIRTVGTFFVGNFYGLYTTYKLILNKEKNIDVKTEAEKGFFFFAATIITNSEEIECAVEYVKNSKELQKAAKYIEDQVK